MTENHKSARRCLCKKRGQLKWAFRSCNGPCIGWIGSYQRYIKTSANFYEQIKSILKHPENCQLKSTLLILGYKGARIPSILRAKNPLESIEVLQESLAETAGERKFEGSV